jgi:probable rRNA maturation factor
LIIARPKLTGVSIASLERFALTAKRAARLRGEVAILVTNSASIRRLNRDFRGKDNPTDVLSFPSTAKGLAGDIAISAQIASKQAKSLGHTLGTELKVLILHGMIHLAGHDHESDAGEMAALEAKLQKKLKLPQGLIERTTSRSPVASKKVRRSSR